MYEIGERAIIKNNICYENGSRGIDISNSSYMLIAHNVCYRNGKAGIGLYAGTRRGGITYGDERRRRRSAVQRRVGNILMDNWYEPLLPKDEVKDGPELIMPDPKYKSNNANVSDYNLFFRTKNRRSASGTTTRSRSSAISRIGRPAPGRTVIPLWPNRCSRIWPTTTSTRSPRARPSRWYARAWASAWTTRERTSTTTRC